MLVSYLIVKVYRTESLIILQTFLRMYFELNLCHQSAADKETLAVLTSHCDEQNEETKEALGGSRGATGFKRETLQVR